VPYNDRLIDGDRVKEGDNSLHIAVNRLTAIPL
jgi:hypothetical protein